MGKAGWDNYPFKQPTFERNTPAGFDNGNIRYLQFRYRAELMSDANIGPAMGNPNTAVLYYEVQHNDSYKTNEDTNIVYTYRLKVNKTDGTNALDGAQFQLFKKYCTTDSEFLPSDVPAGRDMGSGFTFHGLDNAVTTLDFTKASRANGYSGMPGDYYLVNETSATAGDSEFIWNGIDDGYYILVETHAPQGYRPLGEPLLFQIETQVKQNTPGFTSGDIKCLPADYEATYFTSSQLSEAVVEYVAGIPNTPYPGIKIAKIDETTRNDATPKRLKGAQFTIQKWNGKDYYPYTPVDMTNTENHIANSTATTDDNGVAVFPKLEPGEYVIEETVLPNGYVKLVSNDIYFNVEYESDGKQKITRYKTPMTTKPTENGGVVVVSRVEVSEPYDETIGVYFTPRTDSEDAIFTVGNVPGVALPSTGGPGTALIYGAGAGLMLIAILGLVLTNRKRGRGAGIE